MGEMRRIRKLGRLELLELVSELTDDVEMLQGRVRELTSQEKMQQEKEAGEAVPTGGLSEVLDRAVREMYTVAQRTQLEMDTYVRQVRQEAAQQQGRSWQTAQVALVQLGSVMQAIDAFQQATQGTLGQVRDVMAGLQEMMRTQAAQTDTAHHEGHEAK